MTIYEHSMIVHELLFALLTLMNEEGFNQHESCPPLEGVGGGNSGGQLFILE